MRFDFTSSMLGQTILDWRMLLPIVCGRSGKKRVPLSGRKFQCCLLPTACLAGQFRSPGASSQSSHSHWRRSRRSARIFRRRHHRAPVRPTVEERSYALPAGASSGPDPYAIETKHTAALVAERLLPDGLTSRDWYFAFQSQGMSGGPWIGPTVEETLESSPPRGSSRRRACSLLVFSAITSKYSMTSISRFRRRPRNWD